MFLSRSVVILAYRSEPPRSLNLLGRSSNQPEAVIAWNGTLVAIYLAETTELSSLASDTGETKMTTMNHLHDAQMAASDALSHLVSSARPAEEQTSRLANAAGSAFTGVALCGGAMAALALPQGRDWLLAQLYHLAEVAGDTWTSEQQALEEATRDISADYDERFIAPSRV